MGRSGIIARPLPVLFRKPHAQILLPEHHKVGAAPCEGGDGLAFRAQHLICDAFIWIQAYRRWLRHIVSLRSGPPSMQALNL
jgi:hypothetical protein